MLGEGHVNNHVSLGVPPPNTDMQTPGQVEVLSSCPINTPSGQVEDASSHMVNSPPCQVGVTPHNPGGIKPFTLVNSLPGQVKVSSLHLINTPLGQGEDLSSHTVNSPLCQVGVTPRKQEGIKPFTTVNSLPCQVRAMSLHLINTLSGTLGVTSSISSQVPTLTLPCVTPVSPLSMSAPVLDLISYGSPHVASPQCPLSLDTASAPLKTMQAMSHKQLVDLPIGSDHL